MNRWYRSSHLVPRARLNDMRPGSIVGAVWRCGEPTCHCAQPDDPGHGPTLRLTYKWRGKTVTEALPTPAAVHKAQQEIAEFGNYQQLGGCQRASLPFAPARGDFDPGENNGRKLHQEIAREVDQFLGVVFQDRRKTGRLDLEAIEMAVRSAMHQAGAAALGELLKFEPPNPEQRILPCGCGHQAHYQELRSKPILTAVGRVEMRRPDYLFLAGSRLKRSGMFWTVRGANAILALRCCHLNGRFETTGRAAMPRDLYFCVAHPLRIPNATVTGRWRQRTETELVFKRRPGWIPK